MTGNGVSITDAQLQVANGPQDSLEVSGPTSLDVVSFVLGLHLDFLGSCFIVVACWVGGLMLLLL
jgi:hypothetical protein